MRFLLYVVICLVCLLFFLQYLIWYDGNTERTHFTPDNDKKRLGQATWTLLHAVCDLCDPDKREIAARWIEDLSAIYPCSECRRDMKSYIAANPIDTTTSASLTKWMVMFHNHVNAKLGKPILSSDEYAMSPIRVTSCPSCFRGALD